MKAVIKVLMLEDSPLDAQLIQNVIKVAQIPINAKIVSDKNSFIAQLEAFRPQLVLCDHFLEDFNSHEALRIFKEKELGVPFIMVTGKADEATVSQTLSEGADDYVLKSNLSRLPDAIRKALKRVETEHKLIASEKKFRALIENSHDIISLKDESLLIIYNSPSVKRITGWPEENLEYLKYTHPEDSIRMKRIMKEVLMHPNFPVFTTFRMKHEKGHYIWLEGTITNRLSDPFINAIVSNFRDVTEQIESYENISKSEIALRGFANHLNQIQEEERIRIAREIHDELGQLFAGIKMSLGRLGKITDPISSQTILSSIKEDVDNGIQMLKRIATELRPGILDSLGLIPSIEWLGREFEKKTGIACKTVFDTKVEQFDKDISNCFFRICQEALTNVCKHAEATEVVISAFHDGKQLSLQIMDNGKGMPGEKIQNPFSMGLLGMRERAMAIGAHLKITSERDSGTSIYLKTTI